ncbi:hypothetical protein CYLTODRAFT_324441, partial [Cylindrobasidium torrendii FP15055 ss-10]
YYKEDGDCVLLVENILFKVIFSFFTLLAPFHVKQVHRHVLTREESSFSYLFALPQRETRIDGTSDEHPIILSGDSAVKFAHFLWTCYALPTQFAARCNPLNVDINTSLDIAEVANKYAVEDTQNWAMGLVQTYLKIKCNPPYLFNGADYDVDLANAFRLCEIAQLCEKRKIIELVLELLATKWDTCLRYAYAAMAIGDKYGLPCLAALIHFVRQPLKMTPVELQPQPARWKEGEMDENGIYLSFPQHYRILHGQVKIGQAWHELAGSNESIMGSLFRHATCRCDSYNSRQFCSKASCSVTWLPRWQRALEAPSVVVVSPMDVIERLKMV